jgi:hypothetical protein
VEEVLMKKRFCFCCGEELEPSKLYDRYDTCGKLECDREARNQMAEERDEAHEQLDRDMGW